MKTNWQIKKINEITEVSSGNSAPQKKIFFECGIFPFFRTSDVGKAHLSDNLLDVRDYLNEKGVEGLKLFLKGTILFPKSGASTFLNHRVVMGCDGYVSSHLATITPNINEVDSKYIYYFLTTIDAKGIAPNSSYPSLKISDISKIEIPIPPLKTQKEIVVKLDEKFAKLREAKKLREEALLDTEKILSQNLREIFEEGKQKLWEEKAIEEITEIVTKGTTPKTLGRSFTDSGVPFLKAENIAGGPVDLKLLRTFISSETNDLLNRSKTKSGDVLMTIAGTIGRVGYLPENSPEMNTNQAVAIIRPKKEILSSIFLTYALQSPLIQEGIWSGVVKAAIPNFSLTRIKEILIPLPPILEQQQITSKLDDLLEKNKAVLELQKSQLEDIKLLEKAYLHEAFNGELI